MTKLQSPHPVHLWWWSSVFKLGPQVYDGGDGGDGSEIGGYLWFG